MKRSSPPPPPTDPYLASEQQAAQNSLVEGMKTQTQGDMASLMSRYGTMLALSGSVGGSPLVSNRSGGLASVVGKP